MKSRKIKDKERDARAFLVFCLRSDILSEKERGSLQFVSHSSLILSFRYATLYKEDTIIASILLRLNLLSLKSDFFFIRERCSFLTISDYIN